MPRKKSSSLDDKSIKNNNKVVAIDKAQKKKNDMASSSPQDKPVKRHRNRPDLANFGQEYAEPGDNARYIDFALGTWNMPTVDMENAEEVKERINWYFMRCRDHDMKPGVVGLANALGVSRQTLWNWKEGVRRANVTRESVDAIKKAYGFLEELWEDFMLNGKVSPPNGIFLGKNHFAYRDVQDVVIAPQNNAEQDMSAEDIAKRYIEDGKTVETTFAEDAER